MNSLKIVDNAAPKIPYLGISIRFADKLKKAEIPCINNLKFSLLVANKRKPYGKAKNLKSKAIKKN